MSFNSVKLMDGVKRVINGFLWLGIEKTKNVSLKIEILKHCEHCVFVVKKIH